MTTANIMIGEMVGSVMCRNCWIAPAPSRDAASYCSLGTSSSDAMKMTMRSPMPHSASIVSAGFDHVGSLNQPGGWMPTLPSSWFTGPVPGLSRKAKAMVAATGGAR